MHSYTDTKGRSWAVNVTYGDIRRVQTACGFDLTTLFDEQLESLSRLQSDFELLVNVAYCLGGEQAKELGPDEFASGMGGDVLAHAAKAVCEATIDFFPDPSRREAMRQLIARMERITRISLDKMAPAALEKIDQQLENLTDEQLEKWLSSSFGDSPESSALNPGG